MFSRHRARVIALLISMVLTTMRVPAQTLPQAKPVVERTFPKLFEKYTGTNGYEDLVLAGDIVSASPAVDFVEHSDPTLTQMRDMLEDPNVQRALQMVRGGLDKPIHSPHDPDNTDHETPLPEYAGFRRLARIMALQEYVALADGRVSKAIDTVRDGLRLGYVVQSGFVISGLVGAAIDTIALTPLARHFDQMALRDCVQVTGVAQEWLKLPTPAENVYDFEHRLLMHTLSAWKSDPSRLQAMVKSSETPDPPTSDEEMAAVELAAYVETNSARLTALLDATAAVANVEFAALIQDIRKPAWQRKRTRKVSSRTDMAHRLYAMVAPYNEMSLAAFNRDSAQIHLLGVHGAIRRFQWENNRLPASLAELKLPSLITDPSTGAPLVYKAAGGHYELYSAGSMGDGATGPIYLPHRKAP